MLDKIVLGTRGSNLALWQAHLIQSLLQQQYPSSTVEIKVIKTKGDMIQNKPLPEIGGKGLFTQEIENELLAETIHIAVHSLKDLPSELPEGLIFAGSPTRGNVRDAFISTKWSSLEEVPNDGCIATGSLRRKTLVQQQKPQVKFVDLRGSIETRLRKLDDNGWDGIIMAQAALERLEKQQLVTESLDPKVFTPAVGQGAVGLEIKETREDVAKVITSIVDADTMYAVTAERSFMSTLQGGCSVPLGAWAQIENEQLTLHGFVGSKTGDTTIRECISGAKNSACELGQKLAQQFIKLGAKQLLAQ
ncbi:hydroxymethylbilane synthase [Candidatus Uabimicrobium amorphum]|uniref:Porphobilinogen deaminase n=1 Tax=Uabimicrobium amorphum TaxID=2596890 RepID=A0A5S9ITL8_UABAM|nr:hydroxymethylbilane synthase [Candidatus Uabimicrobium amorphum]BBM87321.1 porphobilinogen deaminase [Candidatus Uabimicrobium amorphum]